MINILIIKIIIKFLIRLLIIVIIMQIVKMYIIIENHLNKIKLNKRHFFQIIIKILNEWLLII